MTKYMHFSELGVQLEGSTILKTWNHTC